MTKVELLANLKQKMQDDVSLPLRAGATNLVFGEGSPDSEIFFLGEGPGYWEDQKGRPFVGNAGTLLNQSLSAINILREDVFITNVVCFRPPENRDPEDFEITAYAPYIDEMIKIIEPKMIVTLGRFSMGKFFPGIRISSVHGQVHKVLLNGQEIVVVPMYHPAAALRNGEVMRQFKEDFNRFAQVLAEMNKKEEVKKPEPEQMQLI